MFKKKKSLISLSVALILILSMVNVVHATDATWTHPTSPMVVDKNIVTVAAHRAAQTAPAFLGANLVASANLVNKTDKSAAEIFESAKTSAMLGIFGSSANANPDPYIYNYFYNTYADANGKTLSNDYVYDTATGSPFQADTTIVPEYGTSISLVRRPDVLFGTGAANEKTYVDLIADLPENKDNDPNNDYDPRLIVYQVSTTYDMISALKNLAGAMQDVIVESKGTKYARYGDPAVIAGNYEKYIKGIQFHVLSQLESKGVQKKTVAIIDPKDLGDGTFTAFNSNVSSGTAGATRAAEYVETTTINLIEKLNIKNVGTDETPAYKLTTQDLTQADVIFIAGTQGASMSEDDFVTMLVDTYKVNKDDIPIIYASNPDAVYGIVMNSTENALGFGVFQGFMYFDDLGFNPIYAAAFFYENFYHLTDANALQSAISANFQNASLPSKVTTDLSNYSAKDFEAKLIEGMRYYEKHAGKYAGTKLEWNVDWTRGFGATVSGGDSDGDADTDFAFNFTDIANHWAKDSIGKVVSRGLLKGVSDTEFAPEERTSRAMVVTVLHRYDGEKKAGFGKFTDVSAGTWYSDAVSWAAANGIVKGTTETTFAPNDNVTREQLATILYQYAQYKNVANDTKGDLNKFGDNAKISGYAVDAMKWAVGNGIITGKDGNLIDPQGVATRAEVAVMLQRFIDLV
jgi:hypothetical protein